MKRWFLVEVQSLGRTSKVGRIYCTASDLRAKVGPYATITANGHCLIYGRP